MYSLSRVILLIAAVDALVVTAVLVVQVVFTAAGATGATGWVQRQLRRDRRQSRRGGYAAMRRQCRDRRIPQETVRLVHVVPVHHVPLEIVHGIHSGTGYSNARWTITFGFNSQQARVCALLLHRLILAINAKF